MIFRVAGRWIFLTLNRVRSAVSPLSKMSNYSLQQLLCHQIPQTFIFPLLIILFLLSRKTEMTIQLLMEPTQCNPLHAESLNCCLKDTHHFGSESPWEALWQLTTIPSYPYHCWPTTAGSSCYNPQGMYLIKSQLDITTQYLQPSSTLTPLLHWKSVHWKGSFNNST